jgi:hypothetical protein
MGELNGTYDGGEATTQLWDDIIEGGEANTMYPAGGTMITFTGTVKEKVSGTAVANKALTINIIGAATAAVTATTDPLGAYSATYSGAPGSYSAIASTAADSKYKSAASPSVPFTVDLLDLTITLNIV